MGADSAAARPDEGGATAARIAADKKVASQLASAGAPKGPARSDVTDPAEEIAGTRAPKICRMASDGSDGRSGTAMVRTARVPPCGRAPEAWPGTLVFSSAVRSLCTALRPTHTALVREGGVSSLLGVLSI